MGRAEPTIVKPPAAFRRDTRAKRARATVNKLIPTLLSAHPRARHGIERSELIIDPPALHQCENERGRVKRPVEHGDLDDVAGRRRGPNAASHGQRERKGDERLPEKNMPQDETKVTPDSWPENASCIKIPRISLCVADTLTAAHSLIDPGPLNAKQQYTSRVPDTKCKVGILNMASPLSPGGGFLNGATSQEESLCMCTTLLPALRDEFYRLPELGVVHTPDVLVFRSGSPLPSAIEKGGMEGEDKKDLIPKKDRWFVDVVSAAMLRLPDIEHGRYASATDRELVVRKMRSVLRVFAAKGCSRIVLGAWGCGAYGNPISEIAEAWRRVLLGLDPNLNGEGEKMSNGTSNATAQDRQKDGGRRKDRGKGGKDKNSRNGDAEKWSAYFEDVVFAIKDGGMAASFVRAFGEDVLPLPTSLSSDGKRGSLSSASSCKDGNSIEIAHIKELREKTAQLEAQLQQVVRSPHLKVGLETLLASLRKQLPAEDDENEDEVPSILAQEYSDGSSEDED
ncbi:hypothetical protein GQX73_g9166 [Xylaria multiplex]|uniref:Microbial-type PARG catalytic domain-containing protein n=1 Tax=Xylaria multiplex TaxID=323545 RepID=A0A7C8N1Q1_9PEZI|nr:hypothetical protein GQX73_g9166 [Xylaria multiplex]